MMDRRRIGLTLAQVMVGCSAGVLTGGVSLFCINLIWRGNWQTHLGGFLTAMALLASFLIVYGASILGTAEGVRQMGRLMPREASRRKIYEGAFLGICAAVAILTVTRGDWTTTLSEWGGPIRVLGALVYYVLVVPVKLATGWIPVYALLLIAGPIGASIGYTIKPMEEETPEADGSDQQPAKGK